MARVTTEDCVESVPNRFELVIYACKRAREITAGSEIDIEKNNDKNTVVALREIAEKKVDLNELKDSIVKIYRDIRPLKKLTLKMLIQFLLKITPLKYRLIILKKRMLQKKIGKKFL